MRATASPPLRSLPRTVMVLGAGAGVLAAVTLYLWARYGGAVFHEMIAAGLALCF
jgi:hypothetical protein